MNDAHWGVFAKPTHPPEHARQSFIKILFLEIGEHMVKMIVTGAQHHSEHLADFRSIGLFTVHTLLSFILVLNLKSRKRKRN